MNELFLKQMQDILQDEYPAYHTCLEQEPYRGFRINLLKTDAETLFSRMPLEHEKSPYACNGYYTGNAHYGATPEYMSGAFYMQEASASAAVTIMQPKKGMRILDMCAAPGSKTTQILELMQQDGLLVSNEFDKKRSRILLENVERNGAANCIVMNNDTKYLAQHFAGWFDMVLCDAPCSGEGMMRKNSTAIEQWTPQLVEQCASLQKEILDNAYACLKEDGILVYSTCTLNMQENEYQIRDFLIRHPDMEMVKADVPFGRNALLEEKNITYARRIYPMDKGEGHFIAKLKKTSSTTPNKIKECKSDKIPEEIKKQLADNINPLYPYLYYKNNKVYGGTYPFIDTGKCNVLRNQVYIGEMLKGRFEFSHHFFMSAYTKCKHTYEMNDEEVRRYMHGEQIAANLQKGWYGMCYHGFVIGGAKCDGKALKNKYPKAFRTR